LYKFKPITAGTYTFNLVSVSDANGCNGTVSGNPVTITVNPLPTASMVAPAQSSICLGDSVTLVNLTGSAPWTITYNTSAGIQTVSGIMTSPYKFKPTVAGTYTISLVSVSDNNGCNGIVTGNPVSITVNSLPTVTLTYNQTVKIGDNVNLMTLTGKAPWNVVYNDGTRDVTLSVNTSPYVFTPTTAGIYTFKLVSVSDANGCTNLISGSVTITVNTVVGNNASLMDLSVSEGTLNPVFDKNIFDYTVDVAYNIDSITIFAQTTDPNATIKGTGRFFLFIGMNTFPVIVTADDGATIQIYTVKVIRSSVGIEKVEVSQNINVYPNPTRDMLHIVSDLQIKQIEIYDANGKLVKQIVNPEQTISIVELPKGIYTLQIQTDKGIAIKKVVKQ
jgi:hypothetical protein